jgi:hypothetical protein
MKTRISNIETGFWGRTHKSTKDRRIIHTDVDGNQTVIKKDEEIKSGFFSSSFTLQLLDTSNNTVDVDFSGIVITKDGIKVNGLITVTASIADDDEKILRVFNDEQKEIELFKNSVIHFVQKLINGIVASKLKGSIVDLTDFLLKSKTEITVLNDCCYEAKSFTIKNLDLQDKALNELLNKTVMEKQKEEHSKELTLIRLEQTKKEQELKVSETKGLIDIENTKEENKIELGKKKALADLEIERKKFQLDNTKRVVDRLNKIKEADILKNKEGQMAYFPKEMFSLLERENELLLLQENDRQKIIQTAFSQLYNSNQSFQAGQLIAVKKILENFFNIQLGDINETRPNTQVIDANLNNILDKKDSAKPETNTNDIKEE